MKLLLSKQQDVICGLFKKHSQRIILRVIKEFWFSQKTLDLKNLKIIALMKVNILCKPICAPV